MNLAPRCGWLHAAALIVSATLATGQVATPPNTRSAPATDKVPRADETIALNPFEVKADPDNSYGALNSNSITAFNVPLDRVPVTADILTERFLKDVGALNLEDALVSFDAGATFGGANLINNPSVNQPGDHGSNPGLGLRGSRGVLPQIDGIQLNAGNYGNTSFGSTSIYDTERIEVLDGPQALLFDGAGPGGAINVVQKQAYFGRPAFGEFSFRVDQYGTKWATFDYGASKGNFAYRLALVDGSLQTRRVNLSDRMKGAYVQLAGKLWNTTVRLSLKQSVDTRTYQDYTTISSSGDPVYGKYNGLGLEYLLATNQTSSLDNGHINWDNSASFAGYQYTDFAVGESATLKVQTVWTKWLSTELTGGLANFDDMQAGYSTTLNFYSPGATANPSPGNWTRGFPVGGNPMQASWRPHIGKAFRFVAVASHDFLGGRAKSKTSFDIDSTSETASLPLYNYYQADSNWQILRPTTGTSPLYGRTQLPGPMYWTVNDGPVLYSLFNPNVNRITWNGVNYVQQAQNLGPQGRNYYFQKGFAVVNYTNWFDGRFDTMIGARLNEQNGVQNSVAQPPLHKPEYSAGGVYHVSSWLAPYFQASDLWLTSNAQQPDGTYAPVNHNLNFELGVKIHPENSKVSGSLSVYQRLDTAEVFSGNAISSLVSPNGLNGQIPSGTANNIDANVRTHGATAALTASPTRDWRMRLSAAWTGGTFRSRSVFGQLYNDQFYANGSGQVTYADGTVVFVPAVFNRNQLTVPAGTAGAVPLTIALLSNPSSQYFAQPQPVTGAVLKTSNGGLVLLSAPDKTHGSLLTGKTGLPISSAYQLDPALSGVKPDGVVYAAEPGGATFGYPQYALTFTNVYEFSGEPLRGFKLGGTFSANSRYLVKYYYSGLTNAHPENLQKFYYPTYAKFDLITGYSHKFRRFIWSTQVNVNNVFNNYKVVLYPNYSNGFNTPSQISANLYGQPRAYVWTNRFGF